MAEQSNFVSFWIVTYFWKTIAEIKKSVSGLTSIAWGVDSPTEIDPDVRIQKLNINITNFSFFKPIWFGISILGCKVF